MDELHSEQHNARAEEIEHERQQKRLALAYQRVFLGSAEGRMVLNDLLDKASVFHTTFTGNSRTFFLEGSRNLGLQILSMLEISRYEDLEKIRTDAEVDNG